MQNTMRRKKENKNKPLDRFMQGVGWCTAWLILLGTTCFFTRMILDYFFLG